MVDNVISAKNINKVYGSGKIKAQVLFDINLDVERNSFTALIGPSGSGKSTLLNCLALLDPPTSGSIVIDGKEQAGKDVNSLSKFRNDRIGFVFQFHYLLPEFTALENILIPYNIRHGKAPANIVKEAERLMERIGILGEKHKYLGEMSGGQQQRVSIARALINKPALIFADEPTGNLDTETGGAVLSLMKEINAENNSALVMVTHDRDIALQSDRVVELVNGRIWRSINLKTAGFQGAEKQLENRSCYT